MVAEPNGKRRCGTQEEIDTAFPGEILQLITSFADIPTLLTLRQVSKQLKLCAEQSLNSTHEKKLTMFLLEIYNKNLPKGKSDFRPYCSNLNASQEGLNMLLEKISNKIKFLKMKIHPEVELPDQADFPKKPHIFLAQKLIRFSLVKNLAAIQENVILEQREISFVKLHITVRVKPCSVWKVDENHYALLNIVISLVDGTNPRSGDTEAMKHAWISTEDETLRRYFGKSAPKSIDLVYGHILEEVSEPYYHERTCRRLCALLAMQEALSGMVKPVQKVIDDLNLEELYSFFFDFFTLFNPNISGEQMAEHTERLLDEGTDDYHHSVPPHTEVYESAPVLSSLIDELFGNLLQSTDPSCLHDLEALEIAATKLRGLHQLRANALELVPVVATPNDEGIIGGKKTFSKTWRAGCGDSSLSETITDSNGLFKPEVFSRISFTQATIITIGYGEYLFGREFKGDVELRFSDHKTLRLHYFFEEPSAYVARYMRASVKISSEDQSVASLFKKSEVLCYDSGEDGGDGDFVNIKRNLDSATTANYEELETFCELLGVPCDRKTIAKSILQFLEAVLLASARTFLYAAE